MSVEPDQPDKQWHTGESTNLKLLRNLDDSEHTVEKNLGENLEHKLSFLNSHNVFNDHWTDLLKLLCIQWPLDRTYSAFKDLWTELTEYLLNYLNTTYRVFNDLWTDLQSIQISLHDLQCNRLPLHDLQYSQ